MKSFLIYSVPNPIKADSQFAATASPSVHYSTNERAANYYLVTGKVLMTIKCPFNRKLEACSTIYTQANRFSCKNSYSIFNRIATAEEIILQ